MTPLDNSTRIALFLALMAALCASAASVKAAVFGADERAALRAQDAPLQNRIGTLIATESGSLCSAFCVGPDMIATASHCLFGTSAGARPLLSGLRFRTAREGTSSAGTPLAGHAIGAEAQNIVSGTQSLSVRPPIDAHRDWAIARLEAPVCGAGGLPVSTRSREEAHDAAKAHRMYQVAVHRDLPDNDLRYAGPCNLEFNNVQEPLSVTRDFADANAILFHGCDTAGGSSGSPMLVDGPGGPEVVGINVGTYVVARSIIAARGGGAPEDSEAIANTAITSSEFSGAIAELSARDLITSAADLRALQASLRDAGFYRGGLTGTLTPALTQAVRAFERRLGRPETGLLRKALPADLARWSQQRTTAGR